MNIAWNVKNDLNIKIAWNKFRIHINSNEIYKTQHWFAWKHKTEKKWLHESLKSNITLEILRKLWKS